MTDRFLVIQIYESPFNAEAPRCHMKTHIIKENDAEGMRKLLSSLAWYLDHPPTWDKQVGENGQ